MAASVQVDVEWNGPKVEEYLNKELLLRTRRATAHLWFYIHSKISIEVERDSAGRVIKRSDPKQYPRLDTGKLRNTLEQYVAQDANATVGTVASPQWYAVRLEAQLDREFLSRALNETRIEIKKILVGRKIL